MTQRGVEIVLGRLATDEVLRRRFREAPSRTLGELIDAGVELSSVELSALERLDASELHRFAESLDPRLKKAELVVRGEGGAAAGER